MEPIPRPEFCTVCWQKLPQGNRGRPRRTCGSRCRKRKERMPGWKKSDAFYQKTRESWQIIKGWEHRFGELTQTYPEWAGLTLRDRLLIRLQRDWPIPFCTHCERPYCPDAPDATAKHCSKACRAQVKNTSRKGQGRVFRSYIVAKRVQDDLSVRYCKHCGIKFAPVNSLQLYHRPACRSAAYRQRWGDCAHCGERFERTPSTKIYCKPACKSTAGGRKRRQRYLDSLPTRFCLWCGKPIPRQQLGTMPHKYCKPICVQRHKTFRAGKSTRVPRKSPLRAQLGRSVQTPFYG